MGSRELIESLWKSAREKASGYHAEAEEEARAYEKELMAGKEALRTEFEQDVLISTASKSAAITATAQKAAMNERLLAERNVAGRLLDLARSSLASLGAHDRKGIFSLLVRELPDLPWETVRVHPGDEDLCRRYFPGVRIVLDESISGGMHVSTHDNDVEVINTFEKRLERVWDTLLPLMMLDVRRQTDNDGAA